MTGLCIVEQVTGFHNVIANTLPASFVENVNMAPPSRREKEWSDNPTRAGYRLPDPNRRGFRSNAKPDGWEQPTAAPNTQATTYTHEPSVKLVDILKKTPAQTIRLDWYALAKRHLLSSTLAVKMHSSPLVAGIAWDDVQPLIEDWATVAYYNVHRNEVPLPIPGVSNMLMLAVENLVRKIQDEIPRTDVGNLTAAFVGIENGIFSGPGRSGVVPYTPTLIISASYDDAFSYKDIFRDAIRYGETYMENTRQDLQAFRNRYADDDYMAYAEANDSTRIEAFLSLVQLQSWKIFSDIDDNNIPRKASAVVDRLQDYMVTMLVLGIIHRYNEEIFGAFPSHR